MSDQENRDAEHDLSNEDIITKYRIASGIVNKTFQGVMLKCTPGTLVSEVCKFGDQLITMQAAKEFSSKKNMQKGIAFPTCVSVNNIVCHNSPLDGESQELKAGDMVKIDLGCHIDGYIAVAAHTVVIDAEKGVQTEISGKQADVLHAADVCATVAHKMLRVGNNTSQVTEALKKVAEAFDVKLCQGVLSHQMKRFVIDGNKVILQREEIDQKVETKEFKLNEVYAIDICVTSGDGKLRESEERTTVFKRAIDEQYRLKRKSSRFLFNKVNELAPSLPFSLRAMAVDKESTTQVRAGIIECKKSGLLVPYPVLVEKEGEFVAHIKFTVLLTKSGCNRTTIEKFSVLGADKGKVVTDKVIPKDIKAIMSLSTKTKKKRKKKKKNKA
eukprot:g3928.t1